MKRKSKSIMQSEVFIIIMIIIALLYITMTMYASKLKKENQKLKDINTTTCMDIEDLSDINDTIRKQNPIICAKVKDLKEKNSTTCIDIKDLSDINDTIKKQNPTICAKVKDLKEKNSTTCINIENLSDINDTIKEKNTTICVKPKDLLDRKKMNNTIYELNTTLQKILGKYRDLNRTLQKNKKPPLITLSEEKNKKFRFDEGKASLPKAYKEAFISEKLEEIIDNIKKYDCDTIEVYGYTDTQSLKRINFNRNIDKELHKCLIDNMCSIDSIKFFSNLELGMKRAISIVNFLKEQQKLGKISQKIIIKPYSAGQFIDEYGRISTVQKSDNKKRRRIEIRLSRSKDENSPDTIEEHNILEQKLYKLR